MTLDEKIKLAKQLNEDSNELKRSYEKLRLEILQEMQERDLQRYNVGRCVAKVMPTIRNIVSIPTLLKYVSAQEIMEVATVTQEAANKAWGKSVVSSCLKSVEGKPNVTIE